MAESKFTYFFKGQSISTSIPDASSDILTDYFCQKKSEADQEENKYSITGLVLAFATIALLILILLTAYLIIEKHGTLLHYLLVSGLLAMTVGVWVISWIKCYVISYRQYRFLALAEKIEQMDPEICKKIQEKFYYSNIGFPNVNPYLRSASLSMPLSILVFISIAYFDQQERLDLVIFSLCMIYSCLISYSLNLFVLSTFRKIAYR